MLLSEKKYLMNEMIEGSERAEIFECGIRDRASG
jgi:hypothetical protein